MFLYRDMYHDNQFMSNDFHLDFGEEELNIEEDFDEGYDGFEEEAEVEEEKEEEDNISEKSNQKTPKTIREPFRKDEIREIMKKEMEFAIKGIRYSQEISKEIVGDCTEKVLQQIKNFGGKYFKYLTHSMIMPVTITQFRCYSLNMWEECDDFVTEEVCNDTIRYIMTVWGVNCF